MAQQTSPASRRKRYWLLAGSAVLAVVVAAAIIIPIVLTSGHSHRTAEASASSPSQGPSGASTKVTPPQPTQRDCSASPHTCGYPDATNTGVTPGTKLAKSGCIRATHDNQVVQNVSITNCTITVTARNVTIRNVKIVDNESYMWAIIVRPGASATVDHADISGVDDNQHAIEFAFYSLSGSRTAISHSNLYNCTNCVQGENITATANYIHNVDGAPGAHRDGIQCLAKRGCGLIATGNTVFLPSGGAAIAVRRSFGAPHSATVSGNLVGGGGYTIYGGGSAATNVHIDDNRFSRTLHPKSGSYGPLADFSPNNPGNTFTGNIWDDTGKPLTR